ncbi:hypothetical protein DERF_010406 [Dermatophagoides farinae]|uniref:Uncharacterized protein n=1 Tax=Dermatophagoides farinae TaxID=6954 RepID=A0A922L6V7_DERFA|nr:hypothetical protein DERF_010406 [Dermatophagoides farinae]
MEKMANIQPNTTIQNSKFKIEKMANFKTNTTRSESRKWPISKLTRPVQNSKFKIEKRPNPT